MNYLMESAQEAERLLVQESDNQSLGRLIEAGLRSGQSALDAGCGAGAVTAVMASVVGEGGRIAGVDVSAARLEAARAQTANLANVALHCADLNALPFQTDTFDFVWSQYVLQYLPDRARALGELVRVTRPGGRIAIAEVDGAGFSNWPFPLELEQGYRKLIAAAGEQGFDLFVGRKVFTMFKNMGLKEVRVNLYPQYVVAGTAGKSMIHDWEIRFSALADLATPHFGSAQAYRLFADAFLQMLADDSSLKYAVQLITVGLKP